VAEVAEKREREAQEAAGEAECALAEGLRGLREARAIQAAAGVSVAAEACGEAADLRREIEALRRTCEELVKENAVLEGRLQKCRAAAAADLERAVPLTTPSCWRSVDGPSLKVVTILVRSSCLRRVFAMHLLGTYAWLFFLIFWLEKH